VTIALGRGLSEWLPKPAQGRASEFAATPLAASPAFARTVPRWTLTSAAALPVLLTSAWLVAGQRQPASYSPIRQTVSVMAGYGGTDRWIVTSALYVIGLGYFATAVGLRVLGPWPRVGLALSGAAAIAVASLPEPARGTTSEHVVATAIGAVALAGWPVLIARPGSPARAVVGPGLSTVAAVVSVGLLIWMIIETRNGAALGLAERVSSSLQTCWPFVVALALSRSAPDRQDDHERPCVLDRGVDTFGDAERAAAVGGYEQPQQ
jgi:hypothetical protein